MNDNNEKYRIELSNEEYEYVEKLKQEYYKKLENMTKNERLQYFRDNIAIENKLNFEKEINGTIYKPASFDEAWGDLSGNLQFGGKPRWW